ncbi:uroporphyrinogen-III synthase [Pseudaeromonas paramecii]|uniref:Uroporphyrinogen-III synthase n=1 Tax=Pseudaeromonas paramecii TaxID=2138166 RepID=A0ABP8Q042_9GAMM
MTPLVLRPQPQADALCQALAQAGHHPVCCPLFALTPGRQLSQLPQALAEATLVIAVSAPAVEQAHHWLQAHGLSWPAKPTLAVGPATAAAWQQAGIQALAPEQADSEGLLALPALQPQAVADRPVLILRGDSGREFLAQQLTARGARVRYCECYRREPLPLDGPSLWHKWRSSGVDSVIITSGDLFNRLCQLLPVEAKPWLEQLTYYVPSTRIGDWLAQAGLHHIQLTRGAATAAILAALPTRTP